MKIIEIFLKRIPIISISAILIFSCKKENIQEGVNSTPNDPQGINRAIAKTRLIPVGKLSRTRGSLLAISTGNKILFAAGYGDAISPEPFVVNPYTSRVDIFDVAGNSWSKAELHQGGNTEDGICAVAVGENVYFAGGRLPNEEKSSIIDVYNGSSNQWSVIEFSKPTTHITVAAALDKKAFFCDYDKIHIYDTQNKSWTIVPLSQPRDYLSAVATETKLYLAGGYYLDKFEDLHVSNVIDIYDAATNSWSTSSLTQARASFASLVHENKIYWAGGTTLNDSFSLAKDLEVRDLNSGQSEFYPMVPRFELSAAKTNDHLVFFTGLGLGDPYDNRIGTHFEILELKTDTWLTGVLDQKILGAAMISVNNTIYIAGGSGTGFPPFYDQVWKLEF